ncbi:MAG: PEP/pyruvate-binding domain-containing protein [Myxococcales bacterium]
MRLTVALTDREALDPERVGPKAANLARLAQAGLPTPGGTCIDAAAYRAQLSHLGLEEAAREATGLADPRRRALEVRLALFQKPVAVPVLDAWQGGPAAVRSSALVEDRAGSTCAGQFESYLGVETEADYLTAIRACWAALWSVRALRYLATRGIDCSRTAMAVLVQPFVAARAAGGGLSRTPTGNPLLTATPGGGSAIAQGEVVPDRYLLDGDAVIDSQPGQAESPGCAHAPRRAAPARAACLDRAEARELFGLLRRAEAVFGHPIEIEWVLGDAGFQLVQARPLVLDTADIVEPEPAPAPAGRTVRGQPAGVGRASGRACVVRCECELGRVAPGDVLVTRVAGPGLSHVLPTVAAVVTELGGSTSHLASLARERKIPMVLGAPEATLRIPDGVEIEVDGVRGIARWQRRPRAFQSEGGPDGLRVGLAGRGTEGAGRDRGSRRPADEEAR